MLHANCTLGSGAPMVLAAVAVGSLWLPILASAVGVFVASSLIWMATPLHKHDYKNPGDKEPRLLDALRDAALAPGVYFLPWCMGMADKGAMMEKLKAGPWALVYVQGGPPSMGKNLGAWFAHLLIVGVFVAYVAGTGLAAGAPFLAVFRAVGAAALLAHAGYALPMAIWHGMPWSQVPGRLIDGVIYALVTGGIFAWLWPGVQRVGELPAG
ncbi:MAG: hypothetical protein SFY69_11880 [Planctomycetota bacterium]|nr:hypothetical protein [Planctomycetota bacterium]